MEKLVRFPLDGGDFVVVQVEAPGGQGPLHAGVKTSALAEAQMSFEQAVGKIRPIAGALVDQIKDLGCAEVTLEVSVRLCAEAGLVLAKSGAEAHCRLGLTWRPR